MHQVDIAIVGGGMVGLLLANALKDAGITVAVISDTAIQTPLSAQPELRVSAINAVNAKALDSLGVWQHLPAQRLGPYKKMQVWDKDSFGHIGFDCEEVNAPQLGHIVENQALVNALATQLQTCSHAQYIEGRIEKILWGQQQTMLMLQNDQVVACKLVVGADGANSYIRRQANFALTFKDYDHTAIVATIRTQEPHDQVARQIFTPSGPLALLPLADPHLCSIVWSQDNDKIDDLMAMPDEAFAHALTATSQSVLGVITLESGRKSFPLIMRYAREWVKDGVVILGDAAHTIHPLAGQGANLGMQDALALAEHLCAMHKDNKPYWQKRYLRPYERARKTEALKMIAAMDGFKTLFAGQHPLKKLIRGVGLVATDTLPGLKQRWITQAMGW